MGQPGKQTSGPGKAANLPINPQVYSRWQESPSGWSSNIVACLREACPGNQLPTAALPAYSSAAMMKSSSQALLFLTVPTGRSWA